MRAIEAIDIFCGIGGLTYGLQKAGIEVRAGLDSDPYCRHAYEKNNKAVFIEADIAKYDLTQLNKYYTKNSIKVLVGCAPCQPFSSHAHKNKNKSKSEEWNLINSFANAVEFVNPDIISMENVRGLLHAPIFSKFVNKLENQLGYKLSYKVVYCPDYGIPQSRYRLVMLGANNGGKIEIPKPTHKKSQYKTVRDAIGSLPLIGRGEVDKKDRMHRAKNLAEINVKRIKQSKPGGTWKDWNEELLPECYKKESGKTYRAVYGRMSWDKPSPTITTQFACYGTGRFGHPEQDRALSIREGALLQTFPRKYDFGKSFTDDRVGRHIGNAVPPKLGCAIGKAIVNYCLEKYYA